MLSLRLQLHYSSSLTYYSLSLLPFPTMSSAVAHFEQLSREKQTFDRATRQSEQTLQQTNHRLAQLRHTHSQLQQACHALSTKNGQWMRQAAMHQQELQRLAQVQADEQHQLQVCTQQMEAAKAEERIRQSAFSAEMAQRNDALGKILLQLEHERLVQLVSVDTVPQVLQAMPEDDSNLHQQVHVAQQELEQATQACNATWKAHDHWQSVVQDLRRRAMQGESNQHTVRVCELYKYHIWYNVKETIAPYSHTRLVFLPFFWFTIQPMAEAALLELEQIWGQDNSVDHSSGDGESSSNQHDDSSVHMQLFYGAAPQAIDTM